MTTLDAALSKLKHPSISEKIFLGNTDTVLYEAPPKAGFVGQGKSNLVSEAGNLREVFPMVEFLSEELTEEKETLPWYYNQASEIICSDSPTEIKESLLLGLLTYSGPRDSTDQEDCSFVEYEFFREIMHHVEGLATA